MKARHLFLLVCSPLVFPATASAADICHVILCQSGCFIGRFPSAQLESSDGCDAPADVPGYTDRTYGSYMAPDPVVVSCEPMGSGNFLCETFPIGNFTYDFSVSGAVTLPYPGEPQDNATWVSCAGSGSGVLTVTVISENWTFGSRNRYFNCNGY